MGGAEEGGQQQAKAEAGVELWRHSQPERTNMADFIGWVNREHGELGLPATSYAALYEWSVRDLDAFWMAVWKYTRIEASVAPEQALADAAGSRKMFPRPAFFAGARLNFAENLLYPATSPAIDPAGPALLAATEGGRETVSWAELRARVRRCQRGLQALGVRAGDRVAGYLGNGALAVVAMLAATSLGAVWTAVSPDSGVQMVVDRMAQIEPVVMFVDDGQWYNGKRFGVLDKVAAIMASGVGESVRAVVVWEVVGDDNAAGDKRAAIARAAPAGRAGSEKRRECVRYDEFEALGADNPGEESGGSRERDGIRFEQLGPDHPVYILYSSGTTGAPKCIVHGAAGTLVQHKKEHVLHCDVRPGERLFYFTTVTWMMWHWLVSGLAAGATVVLYDGSPMRYISHPGRSDGSGSASGSTSSETSTADDLGMPRLISELEIAHFGTSAKYLSLLEQRCVRPKQAGVAMQKLKAVYTTASPLPLSTFHYVYAAFGPDVNLASITGGTDIVSLFGAGSPLSPVVAGEVQVRALGMAVRTFAPPDSQDASDRPAARDITDSGDPGDLVCVRPFPAQPVAFWGPDGADKYRASYFATFGDEVWHHGDFIAVSPQTGGMTMLGRSDGVLNPAGIRFGSAEIYNVLLKHFPAAVADGLCVGRCRDGDDDETVLLFLKMNDGHALDDDLKAEIKKKIRADLSARHVPAVVAETPDIPVTVNGKKIEGAVKKIVSLKEKGGKTSASVVNADCLDWYRDWAKNN